MSAYCLCLTIAQIPLFMRVWEGAKICALYFEICPTYFEIGRTYFFFSPGGAKADVRKLTFYRYTTSAFALFYGKAKGLKYKTYKTDMGINALYNKARFTQGS
jgi:hypothetical protein